MFDNCLYLGTRSGFTFYDAHNGEAWYITYCIVWACLESAVIYEVEEKLRNNRCIMIIE